MEETKSRSHAMGLIMGIFVLALLVFTGSRTLDLLKQLLPQDSNVEVYAWIGLAAFDGGVLGWLYMRLFHARGPKQRGLSWLMIWVSLIAVGVSTVADMIMSSANKGLIAAMPEGIRYLVVVIVSLVIVCHVVAFVKYKMDDPENIKQAALLDVEDTIFEEELKTMKENAPALAAYVAPYRYQAWQQRQVQRMLPGMNAPQHIGAPQTAQLAPASFAQTAQLPPAPADYAAMVAELEQLRKQQSSPLQGATSQDPTLARPEKKK